MSIHEDRLRPADDTRRIVLEAAGVRVVLDPATGGRIAQLLVDDLDLILPHEGRDPLNWGAYPMAPWAGRLRDGRLTFGGRTYAFPLTMPPHAIHGTTWTEPWDVVSVLPDDAELACTLGAPWPFGGRVVHRVELEARGLRSTIEVHAGDEPMPAIVGWHPWFPRRLARGGPVELDFAATGLLPRGADGLPGSTPAPMGDGPWDDTFVGVTRPPVVRWPGAMELEVQAETPYWVVFTEHPDGICVEPQTGPPNGLETGPYTLVEPGRPLVASMTLVWRTAG